jgi:hypothetical protein
VAAAEREKKKIHDPLWVKPPRQLKLKRGQSSRNLQRTTRKGNSSTSERKNSEQKKNYKASSQLMTDLWSSFLILTKCSLTSDLKRVFHEAQLGGL